MPIKLFKFAGILVQTLDEEKICSLDIVDDSISVHSVRHFMYIDLFATHSELSGGQKQRVFITMILAQDSEIILLDEPTSALDPISAGKIEDTLYGLKEKYTMLVVTRSMQQASRISNRTGFFLADDLVEYGNTKEMFMNPQKQETEDYITGKFG